MDLCTKDKYSKFFLISALYNIIAAFNGMAFFEVMNNSEPQLVGRSIL
jgi:hypothetical protein